MDGFGMALPAGNTASMNGVFRFIILVLQLQ
jgi:hypothetical protein